VTQVMELGNLVWNITTC